MSTLAVENLVRGFASLLAAIELLQRFMPGTNTGSLAAAVGVPDQGARATPWASRPPSMGPGPLVLAAYLVAFTVVAAVLLQRRDVT